MVVYDAGGGEGLRRSCCARKKQDHVVVAGCGESFCELGYLRASLLEKLPLLLNPTSEQ